MSARQRPSLFVALLLAALSPLASCQSAADSAPTQPVVSSDASPDVAGGDTAALPPYFPPRVGSAWETMSPARLGYDTAALTAALDWAGTQQSTAVVILWRGRIVAERYWHGWTATKDSIIASASKSVLSSQVGELVRAGRIALDRPVTAYLGAGWSRSPSTESRITVRHLLGMMSGLDDSLKFVAQPGTRFYYNSPAYYQLFAVVQAVTGQGINRFSRSQLFDRIGMSSALWIPYAETGEPGFILSCTARDMARFGLLALNRGRWNGTPILADSAWYSAAWDSAPPDNPAYGFLWWLNGRTSYRIPGPYRLPSIQGPLIPDAPTDLVAALGKGDKKIYVIPSLELVIVRHGNEADPNGGNPMALSSFDAQWWERLRPALRY